MNHWTDEELGQLLTDTFRSREVIADDVRIDRVDSVSAPRHWPVALLVAAVVAVVIGATLLAVKPGEQAPVTKQTNLSVTDAVPFPRAYIVRRLPEFGANEYRFTAAVSPTSIALDINDPEVLGPASGQVRIEAVASGRDQARVPAVTTAGTVWGATMEPGSVSLSRDVMIWVQGSEPKELPRQPWGMFAYNQRTAKTTVLTQGTKAAIDLPAAVSAVRPIVSGDRVFWTRVGGTGRAQTFTIRSCRIEACHPRTEVESGSMPAPSGNALYYVGDLDQTTAGRGQLVRRLDLSTRRTTTVATLPKGVGSIGGLSANGGHVAWSVHRPSSGAFMEVLDTSSHASTRVDAGRNGSFGGPIVTDKFVAWGEGNAGSTINAGGYLLELGGEKRLLRLGNSVGLNNIHAAGSVVAFQEAADPDSPRRAVEIVIGRVE